MSTQPDSDFTLLQRAVTVRTALRRASRFWRITIMIMIGCAGIVCAVGANSANDSPEPKQIGANVNDAAKLQSESTISIKHFLQKYCIECHSATSSEGDVNLEKLLIAPPGPADADLWNRVNQTLSLEAMPPTDYEVRPTNDEISQFQASVDLTVFGVNHRKTTDPGRVTVRRLNRTEYNNTIHDLLGITFRPADDFPSDDVGHGFDNIGDVLTISPLLLEKYLDAAESVSAVALFGMDPQRPPLRRFMFPDLVPVGDTEGGRSGHFGDEKYYETVSSGGVSLEFDCPLEADYVLRVQGCADQSGTELAKMGIGLDDQPPRIFEIPGDAESAFYEARVRVPQGKHRMVARFMNPMADVDASDPSDRNKVRTMIVQAFEIVGPFGLDRDTILKEQSVPKTRAGVIKCAPDHNRQESLRQSLSQFAFRAFRRPVSEEELKPYIDLADRALTQGEPFVSAVQSSISAILVSPQFLFRIERDTEPQNASAVHTINDFELASRLSYFFWSTMPDEELFELAGRQSLHQQDVLVRQVRRMLDSPKSKSLTDNFASQWLNLGNLEAFQPGRRGTKTFNETLRHDMRRETDLFFESVMKEDRSLLDFIDAKYTFINERLASHYGIPNVSGAHFRRISLEGHPRAGIMTHASILTLTSQARRTSPVKRGKWVMETMLGQSPPPPPENVPPFEVTERRKPWATMREQLELHRKNPSCASCHQVMDEIGLGFELFDNFGRVRRSDDDGEIDSSGHLPSGESFSGPIELIGIIKKRQDRFVRTFIRSLMTYGLGRGIERYDTPAIEQIVERTSERNYRFSDVVTEFVKSDPFLKRRGD